MGIDIVNRLTQILQIIFVHINLYNLCNLLTMLRIQIVLETRS